MGLRAEIESHYGSDGDIAYRNARVAGALGYHVDRLEEEVAVLSNRRVTPMRGTHLLNATLGKVPVTLEYEYEPEERQTWDEPGHGACASLTDVYIAGRSCGDIESQFTPEQISDWEELCLTLHLVAEAA